MATPGSLPRRAWTYVAILLCLGGGRDRAWASEVSPAEAAAEVVAVVDAQDETTLRALAEQYGTAPWLVVDELEALDALSSASAFATALPEETREEVLAYLGERKRATVAGRARKALARAEGLLQARRFEAALEAVPPGLGPAGSILVLRIGHARARALSALERWAEARTAYEAAASGAEVIGWDTGAAQALGLAGDCARRAGDPTGARAAWERLELAYERAGQVGPAARAAADVGSLDFEAGRYARAAEAYQRSIDRLRLLGDEVNAAFVTGNLVVAYSRMGRYAPALALQYAAIRALEAEEAPAGRLADAYLNLSSLLEAVGDYQDAISALEEAEALYRSCDDGVGAAEAVGNAGVVHFRRGELAKALAALRRAEEGLRAPALQARRVVALANQGDVLLAMGKVEEALAILTEALRIHERLGPAGRPGPVFGTVAQVHTEAGRTEQALEFYRRALGEAERRGEEESQVLQHEGLARVHLARGEPTQSMAAARRCIELLREIGHGLPEGQDADVRGRRADVFEFGARAAMQTGSVPDTVEFLEKGRAGAFLAALGGRERIGYASVPASLESELASARVRSTETLRRYRLARRARTGLVERRARWKEYEAAREALTQSEKRVQMSVRMAADTLTPPVRALGQIQGDLRAGETLVLYALHSERAVAVVITTKKADIVTLVPSSEIEAASGALRDAILEDGDVPAAAQRLHALVIAPLGLDAKARRVYISPDGILSQVPFARLLEGPELAFVPSGTVHWLLRTQEGRRGTKVLALGDPEYDSTTSAQSRTRGDRELPALPGTRKEVEAVGDVILLGADANEAGLHEELESKQGRWRAVHFACHGLIDARRTARSALALTPHPPHDGFLTTFEILATTIPADLVVLSACNSARGRVVRGEGLLGFTRAFMIAGTPRVIASLWPVEDEATQALMTHFYARWNPKDGSEPMSTAAALRSAQAAVRSEAKWKHPRYWAAWALWGLAD